MEILIALIAFLVGVVGNLLASEIYDYCGIASARIIERAVALLPKDDQQRYREEWSSHSEDCAGQLSRLVHALGCLACARSLARLLGEIRRAQTAEDEKAETAAPIKAIHEEVSKKTLDVATEIARHIDEAYSRPEITVDSTYGYIVMGPVKR